MKIFVFDTETTGFIDKKDKSLEKQPKIIQFAGIFGEFKKGEFLEEKRINLLINPNISIPYGASLVNHIYDIDVKNAPKFEEILGQIIEPINKADVIVGHNVEYDEDMMKIELKRLGKEYLYNPKKVFCTMKETVDFCKIQGNGNRFKYPKLGELHKNLFGEYFIGAHDAIVDVEATLRCFLELIKKEKVQVKEIREERLSLF